MILTRPYLLKKLHVKNTKTNLDRVVGMSGIVTEDINKDSVGKVKVDGKTWSAVANNNIKSGTKVLIESINGVKLKVKEEEV